MPAARGEHPRKRCWPLPLAKTPKGSPQTPGPAPPRHKGLQCRCPSSNRWQPAGSSPHMLPPHKIPFCFLLRLKKLRAGGVVVVEHACLSLLAPARLLPQRICNPPAGLVWVRFLLSNSHVFSADFFLRCSPLSPPPLSRDGGEKKKKKKKEGEKREMLNASQLAHTRGDGEICTKELPHSLAAFSSRITQGRRVCSPPYISQAIADKGDLP